MWNHTLTQVYLYPYIELSSGLLITLTINAFKDSTTATIIAGIGAIAGIQSTSTNFIAVSAIVTDVGLTEAKGRGLHLGQIRPTNISTRRQRP